MLTLGTVSLICWFLRRDNTLGCCSFLLNVGVTTLTERVPTATPGDDRGEEAKLRWEWVLESGGVGRRGVREAGSRREGGDAP